VLLRLIVGSPSRTLSQPFALPKPESEDSMNHQRKRYQHGSLTTEKRKTGPVVWVYRWRETDTRGEQVNRKRVIGSKATYPSKAAALRAVDGLRLEINKEVPTGIFQPLSIGQLVQHYREIELGDANPKTARTKAVYGQQFDSHILPRWQEYRMQDVRAVLVESWLAELTLAPGTKAKTRNIMSAVFEHAMRYGWATSNPIKQVRQSSKRLKEPDVLTVVELTSILARLPEPCRTITLTAALTGLRKGELFGLQWQDVNFENSVIHIRRSLVDQVAGNLKTEGSNRPLPMSPELARALDAWQLVTPYAKQSDWVFASPATRGAQPIWGNTLMVKYIQPAAVDAEIVKRIGWHTFRRTFATLLQSTGATVKTTQELLRHRTPIMTLGTYAQAVTSDKREAQNRIAAMILPTRTAETDTLAA
jgi:integrase